MTMLSARPMFVVKRAQTACRLGLDQSLSEMEITPGQYTVLSLLATSKLKSSAEVARQAGVSPQSMGELISQLERDQLIRREENPDHRRMLRITLTPKGTAMLARCDEQVDRLEALLFEGIPQDEIDAFRHVAATIIENSANLASLNTRQQSLEA